MSNLVSHAKRELEAAGLFEEDSDYGGMLGDAVLELIEKFSDQDHSGFSAGIVTELFNKLSRYEPLGPLTGKPDEWQEVANKVYQNNRCSHVFAEGPNGEGAYDIDGRVFIEVDGVGGFTCVESKVPVTFPYSPSVEEIIEGTPEAEDFKHVFER